LADEVLRTSTALNSSEAKTLKSKPRPAVGAAVDVRGAGGGDALDAVDAHAGEAGVQAAHGDLLAFAAVAARQRNAGDALQRLGEVGVGELGDVLGLDHVDDARGLALDVQGAGQAGAEAGDDHFLDSIGIGGGGRLRGVLGVGGGQQGGRGQNRQRAARDETNRADASGDHDFLPDRARARFLLVKQRCQPVRGRSALGAFSHKMRSNPIS
jgi:hypothetical protein